jgi:uncharacterized membrane protein
MIGLARTTYEAAVVLAGNARWMGWNLVLALVPLALAVLLFRGRRQRTPLWWLGTAAFVAFLPNAPYVMTDVIHLFTDVRTVESDAVLSLAVLPQYVLFIGVGVASYTACLLLVGTHQLLLHGVCAIGIYIGRVARLNSWDLLLRPGRVAEAAVESISVRNSLTLLILYCTLFLVHDIAKRLWAARAVLAAR